MYASKRPALKVSKPKERLADLPIELSVGTIILGET